jgi:hypothetical protein
MSWFDQLDIGVDLNALQEHLARSVEEVRDFRLRICSHVLPEK